MIDNYNPTVIINEAPSTYNDNIRYSDSGYFLCVIDSRKVNSGSPVEVKRSDTKRGYRMSENSEGEDIYIEVIPTADGSKEIAWYYLDEAPCVIENPHTFFTPCNINTMELDGFQISGIDEYPLANVVASFDNTVSGNILDMRGMTFDTNHAYKLDFSDFNGTIYMPSTTAKISELNFENVSGSVIGLGNFHTTVSCECSFSDTQINSLNISGINLSNYTEFDTQALLQNSTTVNASGTVFGTSLPQNFVYNNLWNMTEWDLSSLTGDKLDGILPKEDSYDLSGWKIPNSPIPYDSSTGTYGSMIASGYFPYIDVSDWDLTQVTDISGLFHTETLGENSGITGLDTWDVSGIINMSSLFFQNIVPDLDELSVWDVSNVEHFDHMFSPDLSVNDDFSALNDWRDLLSTTATYDHMFDYGSFDTTFPEWNGWIDEDGTFIPYTGGYNPSEVTFKGVVNVLPSSESYQGNIGDAYTLYLSSETDGLYFWDTNNNWTQYQPT